MAEENYRRLSCRECNGAFDHIVAAGRPPVRCQPCREQFTKPPRRRLASGQPCSAQGCTDAALTKGLCNKHYSRLRAHGTTGLLEQCCKQCSATFQADRVKKFCTPKCSSISQGRKRGMLPMEEHLERVRSKKNHFSCLSCGKQAYRKCGGSTLKAGGNKYCSRACAASSRTAAARIKASDRKVLSLLTMVHRRLCAQEELVARKAARCCCKDCGTYVGLQIPWVTTRCHTCQIAYEFARYKASKEAQRNARRKSRRTDVAMARKAWAKVTKRVDFPIVAHRFSPLHVLQRDKWTCQVCGVITPEQHRGKNLPDSPEVDHIVPVSRGGSHTWRNVRCLCRACNAEKKDMLDCEWVALSGRASHNAAAGEVAGDLAITLETATKGPLHCDPTTLTP